MHLWCICPAPHGPVGRPWDVVETMLDLEDEDLTLSSGSIALVAFEVLGKSYTFQNFICKTRVTIPVSPATVLGFCGYWKSKYIFRNIWEKLNTCRHFIIFMVVVKRIECASVCVFIHMCLYYVKKFLEYNISRVYKSGYGPFLEKLLKYSWFAMLC